MSESIINVAVGSKNPVKINSAKLGIQSSLDKSRFNCQVNPIGYDIPSQVSDQPMSDDETKIGAMNRSIGAYHRHIKDSGFNPSFSVGIEGGVAIKDGQMECFAWVAIYNGNYTGYARTSSFTLPLRIRDLVLAGHELGDADDIVFGSINSKQQGGTVGHLTNGIVNRTIYYEQAVVLAMIPFMWPDFYCPK